MPIRKTLHVIGQRPEMTGSGIYLEAIIREAQKHGFANFLLSALVRQLFPDLPMVATCHGTELRQLKGVKTVKEKGIQKGDNPLPENETVFSDPVINLN